MKVLLYAAGGFIVYCFSSSLGGFGQIGHAVIMVLEVQRNKWKQAMSFDVPSLPLCNSCLCTLAKISHVSKENVKTRAKEQGLHRLPNGFSKKGCNASSKNCSKLLHTLLNF